MKKVLAVFIALCALSFLLAVSVFAADDMGKEMTVKGYVSDSMCGAKGAKAGHEECAKKCLDKGAKMVVVTDKDQKILTVDNPEALKGHEGHHVAVTGTVSGDSIHVESAKMM